MCTMYARIPSAPWHSVTRPSPTPLCAPVLVNAGETPTFSAVWDVQPGSIAADISRHVSQAAAQPDGLAMQGQVLFVRLPDNCHEYSVAEALQETAQQLLPRLDCDMKLDVQVCCRALAGVVRHLAVCLRMKREHGQSFGVDGCIAIEPKCCC